MTAPQPVSVGRLTLHAGPMSDADARRLAELVGLALGTVSIRPAETVAVTVPPQTGRTVEQIADTVAHAIEAALREDGAR